MFMNLKGECNCKKVTNPTKKAHPHLAKIRRKNNLNLFDNLKRCAGQAKPRSYFFWT